MITKIQTIPLAEIDPNIKPVYWTKGKQKPCNRSTYFITLGIHITGSNKDITVDGYSVKDIFNRFARSYNAGREVTVFVEKRSWNIERNSENMTPSIRRYELFTRDRKNQPITQGELDKIIRISVESVIGPWRQENR